MEFLLKRRAKSCLSTVRIALNEALYSTTSSLNWPNRQHQSNFTHPVDNKLHRNRPPTTTATKKQGPLRLEDLSLEEISKEHLSVQNTGSLLPQREVAQKHKARSVTWQKARTRQIHAKPTRIYSPPVLKFATKATPLEVAQQSPLEDLIIPVDTNTNFYHGFGVKQFDSKVPESFVEFVKPVLDQFLNNPLIQELAADNHLTGRLFQQATKSFRAHCTNKGYFDGELRLIFDDIKEQKHSPDLLFPHFLSHARQIFPHIDSMSELTQTSDLTQPHNWFPEARAIQRRIIFHAGPTNSGKTYEALQCLKQAESGVYCAPLRLLASEIFAKLNESGIPCDLVTGEDRKFAQDNKHPANHLSTTVEMLSPKAVKDVAVIDEIQMVRDKERGWAFTRALLATAAPEVHVCGEEAAIDIVQRLLDPIGEHVEIRTYKRKSPLTVSTHGLRHLSDVQDGDCLVCFGKATVISLAKRIQKLTGREVAVIYGDMPPLAKKVQAERFNDPESKCKVLVATDAIGMGINLNIGRIVFAALKRASVDKVLIPNYFARQISGRAGRFGLTHQRGYYMALIDSIANRNNHQILDSLMKQKIADIQKAGIAPKWEEIEMLSFLLPNCSFVALLDIFVSICETSENFFVCLPNEMRQLAEAIVHLPMELKDKWNFCLVPIKVRDPVLKKNFVKICQKYADDQVITYEFLHSLIDNLLKYVPGLTGLNNLSAAHDIVGMYLWLSYRYPGYFPDVDRVRKLENELDELFQKRIDDCFQIEKRHETKESEQGKT